MNEVDQLLADPTLTMPLRGGASRGGLGPSGGATSSRRITWISVVGSQKEGTPV